MMVARCGGIVGSDGSVRERDGEGENNKKLNILLNKCVK